MDVNTMIESYVEQVVAHLPRRQRADIGVELRTLVTEEVGERAAATGQAPDAEIIAAVLSGFGPPRQMADRYRPAGFTIIRPAEAPRFVRIALAGIALQWAITLPAALTGSVGPAASSATSGEVLGRLAGWWLTFGLGAFWWPGLMVTYTAFAAWWEGRRANSVAWTPSKLGDRDAVNRPLGMVYLAAAIIGASCVIVLPWLGTVAPGLAPAVIEAFRFDPEFLAQRAPWVLVLWVASLVLHLVVLARGRWDSRTRQADVAINLGWLALFTWSLAAGPIFVNPDADGVTKLAFLALIVVVLVDLMVSLRRTTVPLRPPVT